MTSDANAVADVPRGPDGKKLKPARKQVKPGEVEKKMPEQTGKEYNIWYNKWAGGDREDAYSNKTKSQTRCNIKKDSGWTRANTTGIAYCCLFYARGCCPYGYECEYRHTLPDPKLTLPDSSRDCFAREKFADYRDDMGGVGSFNRQNRTLYIGRIKETGPGPETQEIVVRHFKEWGPIEKSRVLQHRSVAFVTYEHEVHAQFAKESMACQSLDNDEILNVRWATEDPNPTAKVEEMDRLEKIGAEAVQSRMDPTIVNAMRTVRALEDEIVLSDSDEDEDALPPNKRARIEAPPEPPAKSIGLLNADTLESLKYFAEIRQRDAGKFVSPRTTAIKVLTAPTGLGVADYGSDDE